MPLRKSKVDHPKNREEQPPFMEDEHPFQEYLARSSPSRQPAAIETAAQSLIGLVVFFNLLCQVKSNALLSMFAFTFGKPSLMFCSCYCYV